MDIETWYDMDYHTYNMPVAYQNLKVSVNHTALVW